MKKCFYQATILFLVIAIFFPSEVFAFVPTDPQFVEQNYLTQISAPAGWDIQKRADDVVVAVIDTGVDLDNPELFNSIWINKKEIPNNNIDDDGNGYIDDVNGWNFVDNNNNPRADFYSDITRIGVSHGTAVAGIISAEPNNGIGISGLAPGAKIMSLRALTSKGEGKFEDVIRAIYYAIHNGANIINLSMVSPKTNDQFETAIKAAVAKNVLIVSAAGNETESSYENDRSINLNGELRFPICSNNGVGVVGVGSVNEQDVKSPFSNYGSNCLDISAPGEGFISVTPFNPLLDQYRSYTNGLFTGTSVSSPLVAGAAALIWERNLKLSAAEVEKIIINNSDNINTKNPLYSGQIGGRLNVYKALQATEPYVSKDTYVAAAVSGEEPWVYVFDDKGGVSNKFLAYDKKFKGGVRVVSADLNGDGHAEIITVPGAGGGPHVKIFDSHGNLMNQFMAGPSDQTGGLALSIINNPLNKLIAVVNQKTKQPTVNIYDWHGKNINSFNLKKEKTNIDLWVANINFDNLGSDEVAILNSVSKTIDIYDWHGKVLAQWNFSLNQSGATDFYSHEGGGLVVSSKDKSYEYNNGATVNVFDAGLLQNVDNGVIVIKRTDNQFITIKSAIKQVFEVEKLSNKIGNLRLLNE